MSVTKMPLLDFKEVFMEKKRNDVTVIPLSGELDHHTAAALRKKLDRLISTSHAGVVLDFSEVTLMDSSGIGLIIGRYKKLQEKGRPLYVKNLNRQIDKVFKISGLYRIIKRI